MSWRKGNPGSNHSTLWTRTALSPASLGWHHPPQPILRPATKVVFPKRKQEHTTPSAYNPWAALCCPLGKPVLGLWWWVAACLSSPFPRPQPQLTLGSSPSTHFSLHTWAQACIRLECRPPARLLGLLLLSLPDSAWLCLL